MTTQIERQQKRWATFSGRLISRICSAEDYGLIDEARALECKYDIIQDAWLRSNSAAKNRLSRYFGAPEDSVDLQKELNNPAYRRHLKSPHLSATPPPLRRYIKARNDRVRKFEIWRPSDALAQIVAHLVRGSGKGANRALDQAMVARRKEIQALHKAIESCVSEMLVGPSSAVPWQLGHVYLLRSLAGQDLETTREENRKLATVIVLLRRC